ncbi:MAG: nitroreductase [Pseudomonadota bacterium]
MQRSDETLSFLKTRRSAALSLLADPGPSKEELTDLLTIAARVPDHGRLEPWRFLVIKRKAGERIGLELEALARRVFPDKIEEEYARERTRLSRAPMAVAVIYTPLEHPRIPEWEMFLSAGAATMNLVTAATAMGFGANWISGWWCDNAEGRALLGLEEHERIAGVVHLGSIESPMEDRPRPDIAAKTSYLED